MKSSNLFNCAVRIKKEPIDMSPIENGYSIIGKGPDVKNVQSRIPQEYTTRKEYNENREAEFDQIKIECECKDVKPVTNSLVFKKIDDHFQNQDDNKTQKIVKIETMGRVKREINLITDCEVSQTNKKRRIVKMFNKIKKRKIHTKHLCGTCGKKFAQKINLQNHINEVHNGIRYTCDICQSTFSRKDTVRHHANAVHYGIGHTCIICQQVFQRNSYLQNHIDSVHSGITHACDVCRKEFKHMSSIKHHKNVVHNGIIYPCNICGKKYKTKKHVKIHIDRVHHSHS
ncbi:zinc finger protein 616-like [Trichogramma pretiosum]|uniref:zinc finger protein 616-like n=1 Tax=Trichogramma pretiosum TaxID=7493 RepID=UPI0006C94835|nr:zinc finger protein 616-like [Trichogramma pretiosum]XP_023317401.1 zinc finger protein 616-like [Trichogramma pretiosum]